MTKFQAIRQIANIYGPSLPTKSIIEKVNKDYGLEVSPQNVNAAIGSQKKRRLLAADGSQFHDTKQFVQKNFDGDFDLCFEVLSLMRRSIS